MLGLPGVWVVMLGGLWGCDEMRIWGLRHTTSSSSNAKAARMLTAAPGDGGGCPLPCLSTTSGHIARGPAPMDGVSAPCCMAQLLYIA